MCSFIAGLSLLSQPACVFVICCLVTQSDIIDWLARGQGFVARQRSLCARFSCTGTRMQLWFKGGKSFAKRTTPVDKAWHWFRPLRAALATALHGLWMSVLVTGISRVHVGVCERFGFSHYPMCVVYGPDEMAYTRYMHVWMFVFYRGVWQSLFACRTRRWSRGTEGLFLSYFLFCFMFLGEWRVHTLNVLGG